MYTSKTNMAGGEEDANWTLELETALIEGCDYGKIRTICKGRPVPAHLRSEVWQICLNIAEKGDQMGAFDELYDMTEQAILREDSQNLVEHVLSFLEQIGNDEEEKVSVASDLESILTFYCKSRSLKYESGNGWLEMLQPMLALKFGKADLYNCFYAMVTKFIPRDCVKNGKPFHLFRLLLLYHDPQLCSFLDSKRVSPDTYAHNWFRSLFGATCDLNVTLNMWDVYLQQGDPFLVFFLALVILVNAKEQILTMKNCTKQELIDKLTTFPSALEADDIEDFCGLAQYYASKTPQSFRRDYQMPLYGTTLASQKETSDVQVSQALCLPVSVSELLRANTQAVEKAPESIMDESVRYFVVDCRPAEQYNAGHLSTAFHLDANLMLQNPTEFGSAVQSLSAMKAQAIAAGSVAGGDHLCFMGSGREEEDQYVYMVVAHFLQKNSQYVSVARGGYSALHEELRDNLSERLMDHSARSCIVCNPENARSNDTDQEDEFNSSEKEDSLLGKFGKLTTVVKTKGVSVKAKMINYIKNEQGLLETRHVSSGETAGKRYRNMGSVFTIGDDDEGAEMASSDDERRDTINIETWLNKPDVTSAYQCTEVKETGYTYPSHLLITDKHMYILRDIPNKKGMAWIQARRSLGNIVKITSKKRHPELITFKYGSNDEESGLKVTDVDRFIIPRAGEATKIIKQHIMKVLDALES